MEKSKNHFISRIQITNKQNLVQDILKARTSLHPFYQDSKFDLFVETILQENNQDLSACNELLSKLTEMYHYFSQGNVPKVLVSVNPNNAIYSNSMVIQAHTGLFKFVLDSLIEYIIEHEYKIKLIMNSLLGCVRNDKNQIMELGFPKKNIATESFIHIEIARVPDNMIQKIQSDLDQIINEACLAVSDFSQLSSKLKKIKQLFYDNPYHLPSQLINESNSFLSWLTDDHYVFLGYQTYEKNNTNNSDGKNEAMRLDIKSQLGILKLVENVNKITAPILQKNESGKTELFQSKPIIIDKTSFKSIVHRRVPMDIIEIRELDDQQQPIRWHRFLGLFTRKALFQQANEIPLLEEKLEHILKKKHYIQDSSMYQEIMNIFNSLPKEMLFFTSIDALSDLISLIGATYRKQAIRLFYQYRLHHNLMMLVLTLPEKYLNTSNLNKVTDLLRNQFQIESESIQQHQSRSHPGFWAVYFFLTFSDDKCIPSFVEEELNRKVIQILKSWEDQLMDKILETMSSTSTCSWGKQDDPSPEREQDINYYLSYCNAFPKTYQASNSIDIAMQDLIIIEKLIKTKKNQYKLCNFQEDFPLLSNLSKNDKNLNILKIYACEKIILTDLIPILRRLGLMVIDEKTYSIKINENDLLFLHTFAITGEEKQHLPVNLYGKLIEESLEKIIDGYLGRGYLNALIIKMRFNYIQLSILRTYFNYYFQTERLYTQKTVAQILIQHATVSKMLVDYFDLKFNPKHNLSIDARKVDLSKLEAHIENEIKNVDKLSDDRILTIFLNLFQCTLRTNFYTRKSNDSLITLKLNSQQLNHITLPKPFREIYVFGKQLIGIHLRGGKIARGGIRFSDRLDDLRTEILALMKTQMIKNTLIVPVGSKGGFIIRNVSEAQYNDPEFIKTKYREFISAILEITDNIVDNSHQPEPTQLYYDEHDPYLVVAADKGTAHLSDVANEVSKDYGFWLDDAFASGGSNGYDHKKIGITAKGTFESVKQHFREMTKDITKETFSVVAIGDMSGDVFGNGMILSDKILLKAAFNHMHIFLDPNPEANQSFKERQRLAQLARSSWMGYNPKLISKGGGVFLRSRKSIELSKEVQSFLNIHVSTCSGEQLINLILKVNVDLLWNGGTGTYIKSASETHIQVQDKANDSVRINANELGAKIVGEGGNLGFTQQARVDYAYQGGRINTDAIDNSGGVNMSDHEVNTKILLTLLQKSNIIKDTNARNQLLKRSTDYFTQKIVYNNYQTALALSMDSIYSKQHIDLFQDLMDDLAKENILSMKDHFMPSSQDIAIYKSENKGFLRPQLAVLMSHEKMHLYQQLFDSPCTTNPYFIKYLIHYFPKEIHQLASSELIKKHALKREIITTQITNHIIHCAGMTFLYEMKRYTGYRYPQITENYLLVENTLKVTELRKSIHQLADSLEPKFLYDLLSSIESIIRLNVHWNLVFKQYLCIDRDQMQQIHNLVNNYQQEYIKQIDNIEDAIQPYIQKGIPKDLALQLIKLNFSKNVFMYLGLYDRTQCSLIEGYHLVEKGNRLFGLNEIIPYLDKIKSISVWDQLLENQLKIESLSIQYSIAKQLHDVDSPENFIHTKQEQIDDYFIWIKRLKQEKNPSFDHLAIILKFLWHIIR